MKAKPKGLKKRQRAIEPFGLQSAGLSATRREKGGELIILLIGCTGRFHSVKRQSTWIKSQDSAVPYTFLPKQFTSRQRRKAICNRGNERGRAEL